VISSGSDTLSNKKLHKYKYKVPLYFHKYKYKVALYCMFFLEVCFFKNQQTIKLG
jgi:hypothetical protein